MKHIKSLCVYSIACCMVVVFLPLVAWAQIPDLPPPSTYITYDQWFKAKALYDDPRPIVKSLPYSQILPKQLYEKLIFDQEKMKSLWAEVVGFRAPDVVGKVAPEIKPGKYTYQDLAKYPGLKQLMHPYYYDRIKPGGPPYVANMPEIEVVPTQQYYWALPIAEATKKGGAKLDDKGYIVPGTWTGGFPFARPEGKFKGEQVMQNVFRRSYAWENTSFELWKDEGFTKDLRNDISISLFVQQARLQGRSLLEPYGWFDERAKGNGEFKVFYLKFTSPRDAAGTVQNIIMFDDPTKLDQVYLYIPSLRRIRKLTATDTQDPVMGMDYIMDDSEQFDQKLSPIRYPYKYEVLEEREYLMPSYSLDGSEYISKKNGYAYMGVKFERRPIWVVKLTQLDKNYVYGSRILLVDRETLTQYALINYDQKGNLYRSLSLTHTFIPEMGMLCTLPGSPSIGIDYRDKHSSLFFCFDIPGYFSRSELSLGEIIKKAK